MSKSIPVWEPLSPDVLADQLGAYDSRRAACPLAESPRGVTLFRHADVVAAARDSQTFSSAALARRAVPNAMDPPEHAAWRGLIDTFFTPAQIAALEPRVRAIADAVVAALPRGATVDAVAQIGAPLAVRAQTEWLGWRGIEDELLGWMADNHAATRSGDRARTAAVAAAFDEIIRAQLQRRRAAGAAAPADPTTALLAATLDGQALDEADIVSILRNWTAGDLGSMAAALGVVVWFLATHPDVQQELRERPAGLAAAIDEMLRIDDPFLVNRRVTTTAVRIDDHELAVGTRVYLNWASANRDEAVFGGPDAYRPDRNAPHNLVYGVGIHACPGRSLATMELVVAVHALLQATPSIEPAPDAAPVRETYPLGGWRRVPVRLG
ncbi:cytochrome P450 [Quisquiliibacterium transsilvanicum]|uniref:Cytochrome P450 n=1 Tax=Quisquiliibacterium transsilvanicum TaxID=1549638 RepID=A0A7W8M7D8_9BURK|nr:cytochrome P450 [Quisquiliibacterium transsilvanicum]MBB5270462.1 cytochrome P450 [Quisquiliibacterium transsilvanicum]